MADQSPAARILIVDDCEDILQLLGKLLTRFGHTVTGVRSGAAALGCLHDFKPTVVLSDISMPGMDGYELARRIRLEPGYERILIIAVSGYGQQSDRASSLEAGFDHHLLKPVDPRQLASILAAHSAQSVE